MTDKIKQFADRVKISKPDFPIKDEKDLRNMKDSEISELLITIIEEIEDIKKKL